jgi:hypothetical protein
MHASERSSNASKKVILPVGWSLTEIRCTRNFIVGNLTWIARRDERQAYARNRPCAGFRAGCVHIGHWVLKMIVVGGLGWNVWVV